MRNFDPEKISKVPTEIIKMNFEDLELRCLANLSEQEKDMLYQNHANLYRLTGRIERAGLDLSANELE